MFWLMYSIARFCVSLTRLKISALLRSLPQWWVRWSLLVGREDPLSPIKTINIFTIQLAREWGRNKQALAQWGMWYGRRHWVLWPHVSNQTSLLVHALFYLTDHVLVRLRCYGEKVNLFCWFTHFDTLLCERGACLHESVGGLQRLGLTIWIGGGGLNWNCVRLTGCR
jgi:hypothetical protein